MKVLIVAPEICPPWTEGRKVFVNDLAGALGYLAEVRALVTVTPGNDAGLPVPTRQSPCSTAAGHLLSLAARLPGALRHWRPDAVFHFPYGTFRGVRGWANEHAIRFVDTTSRRSKAACATVMYAIDEHRTPQQLARRVSGLVAQRGPGWTGPTFSLGIDLARWKTFRRQRSGRTLLFLAGMWQPTPARLEHVLQVRGLDVLLRAGESLSSAGVDLIVASPVFADAALRTTLLRHPHNRWARGSLSLETVVSIPDIHSRADLFVFPYARDITSFVPTSVVESQLSGLPVVMSDVPFLSRLAPEFPGATLFRNGDPADLARIVLDLLDDTKRLEQLSHAARTDAMHRFDIQLSARELIDAVRPAPILSMPG